MADLSWRERQKFCEDWYQAIPAEERAALFAADYEPHRSVLQTLQGFVLDVGGGCGFAGNYLPQSANYVALEPSPRWLRPEWRALANRKDFIMGVGERLPFAALTFDAVLSMWTLNHARSPEETCCEMARVLKPGGRIIVILEESQPRWRDVLDRGLRQTGLRNVARQTVGRKIFYPLLGKKWPIAADHLYIPEQLLLHLLASRNCSAAKREWRGGCLCFDFRKEEPAFTSIEVKKHPRNSS
jgi:SAM-dependent methyltransferase